MEHQTIRRNADGTLTSIECPCGEDHGPSLHEELMIMREGNKAQAERLNDLAEVLRHALDVTKHETVSANLIKTRRLVNDVQIELDRTAHDLTVLS